MNEEGHIPGKLHVGAYEQGVLITSVKGDLEIYHYFNAERAKEIADCIKKCAEESLNSGRN